MNDAIATLSTQVRGVRPIVAPEDGPWSGMLTRLGSGDTCVMVDAAELPAAWHGWAGAESGHVLTPLEVRRSVGGHEIALPVCCERLDDFLHRRARASTPLTAGEKVTILISVLRGASEIDFDPAVTGEWWLTESGRPVLATDVGAQAAVSGSVELLERHFVDTSELEDAGQVIALLSNGRTRESELRDAEDAIFARSAPAPLATTVTGSRAARELSIHDRDGRTEVEPTERTRPTMELLARHMDADLADTFSRATTAVWRRLTRRDERATRHRAPWAVAAAAAVAVMAGGMLWPGGGGSPATAEKPPDSTTGGASPSSSGERTANADASEVDDAEPEADDARDDDLTAVADSLLTRRSRCADDTECLVALTSRGAFDASGVVDLTTNERTITLLDEFGEVAVVRVDAETGGAPSQLVVIERRDDEWLLRDVYDAAQQP